MFEKFEPKIKRLKPAIEATPKLDVVDLVKLVVVEVVVVVVVFVVVVVVVVVVLVVELAAGIADLFIGPYQRHSHTEGQTVSGVKHMTLQSVQF